MVTAMRRGQEARQVGLKRTFKGFPKRLPCLVCGRFRTAQSPAHRIHFACRKTYSQYFGVESFIVIAARESREDET
jgi:hypothetical protein